MKRKWWTLAVLAILCVISAGGYYAVVRGMDVEQTGMLYTLDPDSITQIELQNEYGAFRFERQGALWTVESEGLYRTNPEKMALMTAALSSFPVDRVLEAREQAYGLDPPTATVTFRAGSDTYTFSIGNETASRSSVYIHDEDGGRTMVTGTASVAQFTGSLAAYRDKEVFTIDKSAIRRLAYYRDGELVVEVENQSLRDWAMTYPYTAPARQIELGELVTTLRQLTVAGYPEGLSHAEMGLEHPAAWLEVTDAEGATQRLEIGSTQGPHTYVRTGGADEIVSLYAVDMDFSVLEPDALLFVAPLRENLDALASVSIETAGERYYFGLDHTGSDTTALIDGRELEVADFASIYIKYTAMIADGRDPVEREGKAVVATLTSTYLDGSATVLELLERDGESYHMCIDGDTQYILQADKLEQLLYRLHSVLGSGG